MDKLVEVDAQYREWISEVSKRFYQSQIKAAVKVNDEMLSILLAVRKRTS